jgi:hypothetical protein
MSSLMKWIYSTSLIEVESFYSMAGFSDTFNPEVNPETTVLPMGVVDSSAVDEDDLMTIEPTVSSTTREVGLKVMGSATQFQSRIDKISGELAREEEETRTESVDTLESIAEQVSQKIINTLGRRR